LSYFKTENHPDPGWATYSPSRLGGNMAYATVFGSAFTSGLQQKTTSMKKWTTYPADRSAGSMAYATVFGCYFTSGVYYKL